MNIALVSWGFPRFVRSDMNGISTYSYWLAKGLEQRGHRVFVLTTAEEPFSPKSISDNLSIWYVPVGNIHYYAAKVPYVRRFAYWIKHQEIGASAGRLIQRIDRQYGLDVVEAYGPINFAWAFQSWSRRIPYTMTVHGLPSVFKRQLGIRMTLLERLAERWTRRGFNNAAAVMAPTKFVATELEKVGVDSNRLKFVPPPISSWSSVSASDRPSKRPGSLLCLSLSPINFAKGLDVLAATIPIVKERFPRATFLHIGKAEDTQLERVLLSNGNGAFSHFDAIPWPLVGSYYQIADIVISPSRSEIIGYTILEAMIHHKPVIASRVGGMTDLVVDGETGLLVPPGDVDALAEAIILLLNNRDLRSKMGTAGYERALGFYDLDRIARQKEEIYMDVRQSSHA